MAAVEAAALMLAELELVAREWRRLPEGERASWSIDWSNEMSGLERAAAEVGSGVLTPSQEQAVADLVRRVEGSRRIRAELGLYSPVIPSRA